METYPDFHLETWNGFFAPRGAPDEVADKISRLMRQAVASPEIGGRLRELGIEPIATCAARRHQRCAGKSCRRPSRRLPPGREGVHVSG